MTPAMPGDPPDSFFVRWCMGCGFAPTVSPTLYCAACLEGRKSSVIPDPGENGSAAEMNVRAEAKRRERVVDLARAIYVACYGEPGNSGSPEWALGEAEAFETAAEAYRRQS